jgi:hypothetical protein
VQPVIRAKYSSPEMRFIIRRKSPTLRSVSAAVATMLPGHFQQSHSGTINRRGDDYVFVPLLD